MSQREVENIQKLVENIEHEKKKNRILLSIFVAAVIGFFIILYNHPKMDHQDVLSTVSFPPSVKDLQRLATVLVEYKQKHTAYSVVVFLYLYTLLQAFAIPGPIFLCILAPSLFGGVGSYFLVLSCSSLGASICYYLSYSLAKSLVLRKFPVLFAKFHRMVSAHRQNLFWYMLFLRLTPLIPNWFVNIASPLVNMPYHYFLGATFFGLMPNNFILIQTGLTLQEIDKIGMSYGNILTLLGLGFLALIPTFVTKYMKREGTLGEELGEEERQNLKESQ